jgi:hypothetical protein
MGLGTKLNPAFDAPKLLVSSRYAMSRFGIDARSEYEMHFIASSTVFASSKTARSAIPSKTDLFDLSVFLALHFWHSGAPTLLEASQMSQNQQKRWSTENAEEFFSLGNDTFPFGLSGLMFGDAVSFFGKGVSFFGSFFFSIDGIFLSLGDDFARDFLTGLDITDVLHVMPKFREHAALECFEGTTTRCVT